MCHHFVHKGSSRYLFVIKLLISVEVSGASDPGMDVLHVFGTNRGLCFFQKEKTQEEGGMIAKAGTRKGAGRT